MIIETTDNRFYRVEDINNPDLSHCWQGYPVKLDKRGIWDGKHKKARWQLVSKAHCLRVVEA